MRRLLNVKIRGSVYSVPLEEIIYLENELRKICLHMRKLMKTEILTMIRILLTDGSITR